MQLTCQYHLISKNAGVHMKIKTIACLLFMSNIANAGFLTGNELKEHCFKTGPYHKGICSGFIMGVFDGVYLSEKTWTTNAHSICPPKKVTSGRLKDVVVKFLDEEIENLPKDASELVWDALILAFPCEQ